MNLARLLNWSASLRDRRFPGRFILGRAYKSFLFSIVDPLLKCAYRTAIARKTRSLSPFSLSDYQLLKAVRAHFPAPYLARRWVETLTSQHHVSRYTDVLAQVHGAKLRAKTSRWILPETAVWAPALDCKGFAVLFSSLLNAMGMKNELWIGLPSDERGGHVWVVLDSPQGRIAVDQFNGHGEDETLFRLNHPYAITFRI